jgi:hypothetical protein
LTSARRIHSSVRWIIAAAWLATFIQNANAGEPVEEYRLKAAFVSKFADFVEWPPQAWKSPSDPLLICVLGENPFGSALDQAVSGKTVQDRKIAVRYMTGAAQIAGCQILFVSSSERKHYRSILKLIPANGVLTVSDADNFTSEGGMVDLPLDGERIRIVINLEAVEQARLRISSKLLGLARIVRR